MKMNRENLHDEEKLGDEKLAYTHSDANEAAADKVAH